MWSRSALEAFKNRQHRHKSNRSSHQLLKGKTLRVESLEERRLLSASPIQIGAVYLEDSIGADTAGDVFEVTWEGGAPGTQLAELTVETDKVGDGLTIGDSFFDIESGGLGVSGAVPLEILDSTGFTIVSTAVDDGGTTITFTFGDFDPGEKLRLSVDVDEKGFLTDNPVSEGAEFEGSLLVATFTAPHYYDQGGSGIFWDAYDSKLSASALDLPPDDYGMPGGESLVDQTAGAIFEMQQTPLPASISGTVFEDIDLDNLQDAGETGIAGVSLMLQRFAGGQYADFWMTTVTNSDGFYRFDDLEPGTYQIVETQPTGYYSVGAGAGSVGGATRGTVFDVNTITDIALLGGEDSVENDFSEASDANGSFRLAIFVDSGEIEIAACVGLRPEGGTESLFTVDGSGQVHLDSSSGHKLGDFFDVWQNNAGLADNRPDAILTEDQLFGNIATGDHTVQMFVNGQVSTEFEDYHVQDGDEIVLVYGDNPVLSLNTNFGPIVVELFVDETPITVDNFLNYVNDGDYLNSFFHRSVEDFVVQGGGFTTNSTTFTDTDQFQDIPTDDQIQNEAGISNLRGTIGMAKRGGDPNSATSQFFVNLTDDHATSGASLDTQNGGFTVFAQVLDMTAVDTIADLPITPASDIDNTITASDASLFASLPLGTGNQLVVVQSVTGQGVISGRKYLDENDSGTYDNLDTLLPGATIYLDANNNATLDSGEIWTSTEADGSYRFQVEAGTYIVRSEVNPGHVGTEPLTPDSYSVAVEIGRETSNLNFGERVLPAALTLADLPDEININAGAPVHIALGGQDADGDDLTYTVTSTNPAISATIPKQQTPEGNRSMRITVQGYGEMVFELFEGRAPNTTARIIEIAESGWYENRIFHRIIDGFMFQGGSRDGLGVYGTGTQFDDEYHVDLQFTTPGLLAMAKAGDDTNDSQFFVTDVPSDGFSLPRWLDFNHTIFGRLTKGDDVRDAISQVATDSNNSPVGSPIVIESVEIFYDNQDAVMMISAQHGTFDTGEVAVTVSDGNGNTASKTVKVDVIPDSQNNNPFLGPIDPIRLEINQPYSFQLDATDIEGDRIYYAAELLTETDDIEVAVTENGLVTITPKNEVVGVAEVAFRVGPTAESLVPDSLGQYEEGVIDSQIVTIQIPPAKPLIGFAPGSDTGTLDGKTAKNNSEGNELYLEIEKLQATSQLAMFLNGVETPHEQITRIPQGDGTVNYVATVRLLTGTVLNDGDYTLHVQQSLPLNAEYQGDLVSDLSEPFEFSIDTVPPAITSQAVDTAIQGKAYFYDVNSPEEGAADIFYELQSPVPAGMVLNPVSGEITWTPSLDQLGQHPIGVLVHDGAGNSGHQEFELIVSAEADLGVVDFLLVPDVNLSVGGYFYMLETAYDGILTLEALHSSDDSATVTLYDSAGNALAASHPYDGGQRIDWPTAAGVQYAVELTGNSSDADLRIANLLHREGTNVTVHGTVEADDFLFSAEHSRNITINGVLYEFDDDEVSAVTFDADKTPADQGADVVRLEGSSLPETLTATFLGTELVPTMVFQTESGVVQPFIVTATNFEQLLAWSRSGAADTAVFEDSPGRDKGKALPGENVTMIRSTNGYQGFYRRAKLFEDVSLVGVHNPDDDEIVLCDTPGSDHLEVNADTGASHLVTENGAVCRANGFPEMLVRSLYEDSSDAATFIDSSQNDKFVGRPGKARLYSLIPGAEFDLVVRDFDVIIVDFLNGGYDKVRFADSDQADHLVAKPSSSTFWGPGFHFTARQAEEISLTSLYQGDADTAELHDTALDDLLQCNYDDQDQPTARLWSLDESAQMLYQLLGVEKIDAYGTTGINVAQVENADFVELHGSWNTNIVLAAEDDHYSVDQNAILTIDAASGVLSNDSNANSVTLAQAPTHGVLSLNADGSFTYTPNEDFWGHDMFTYVASDGVSDPVEATVSLTVNLVIFDVGEGSDEE